ncbi:DNA-binding domain-containing protein [Sinorhizobium numidicum]|uniref:DNA-binding domain-containing protein n=1 Tax=Sinorhizobium numidicum TaxID=680248 RepID=A0ABY8CMG4_9HYPH|nr:DNA-binding domain-containing protein [Sinorhizobium numidicum]WEX73864.1 DNA-binding domain-containing protein [Sinorhizobium numidicum]WEX79849.1 DNA-binding domain-containing protein [Sinorhizobium numidicum]
MRAAKAHSREFADGLGYPAGFAPALLDPGGATPALVSGPNGKAADKRFNVYRNNVIVSLIDALAAAFPATLRITGETFFRAMARFHIRETPPTSPLLFEYGRDFPEFIEYYEYAQSMPWLADVARIERAWLDAYHAADAAVLQPGALTSIPPEKLGDLVFEAHPATRIVRSAYPAVTIFSANRSSDPVGRIDATAPESALVTRPALEVEIRRLPPGADTFLGLLLAEKTLSQAATAAGACCPEFNLTAGLLVLLEAGAFAAIRHGG